MYAEYEHKIQFIYSDRRWEQYCRAKWGFWGPVCCDAMRRGVAGDQRRPGQCVLVWQSPHLVTFTETWRSLAGHILFYILCIFHFAPQIGNLQRILLGYICIFLQFTWKCRNFSQYILNGNATFTYSIVPFAFSTRFVVVS